MNLNIVQDFLQNESLLHVYEQYILIVESTSSTINLRKILYLLASDVINITQNPFTLQALAGLNVEDDVAFRSHSCETEHSSQGIWSQRRAIIHFSTMMSCRYRICHMNC